MKGLQVLIGIVCSLLLAACSGQDNQQKLQHFEKARLSAALPQAQPASDEASAAEVTLPTRWREAGTTKWFVLSVNLTTVKDQAIFIPRVANRVELWVNQSFAARWGQRGDTAFDQGKHPVLHSLDAERLKVGNNLIWLRVEGDLAQTKGLSDIYVGDYSAAKSLYFQRWWREVGSAIAIVVACCVLGLFGLWFGLRVRTQHFISFGLASFGWALQSLPVLFASGGWSHTIVLMLAEIGFGVFVSQIQIFAVEQMKIKYRFLLWNAKLLFLIAIFIVPFAYVFEEYTAKILDIYHAVLLLSALITMPFVVVKALRERKTAHWILLIASIAGIAFGTYDLIQIQLSPIGFSKLSLTRFSALIFLLAMVAILLEKQIRSVQLEKNLNEELKYKIAEREKELKNLYENQSKYQENEIKKFEVERIATALHDGMNAKLSALQFLLQDPKFNLADGTKLVKEAVQQLDETIDSISPSKRDLESLVGYQIYRLSEDFKKQNIEINVQKLNLNKNDDLTPAEATHFGFLLRGIFDNILKHSKAKTTRITLGGQNALEGGMKMTIEDDGVGFALDTIKQGRVVPNLVRNASRIGAKATIESRPGVGTKIDFKWD